MSGGGGLLVFLNADVSLNFGPVYAMQLFRAPSDEGRMAPDVLPFHNPAETERKRVRKRQR